MNKMAIGGACAIATFLISCTTDSGTAEGIEQAFDAVAADDLLGHWTFDETGGSSLSDSSSFGHVGTLEGAQRRDDSDRGAVLSFDGRNDYADYGSPRHLDNLRKFSFSVWIRPTKRGDREIVSKGKSNRELRIRDALLRGCVNPNACSVSRQNLDMNAWQHVAMTYDHGGDRRVHLFIDGDEVDYSEHGQNSSSISEDGSSPLYIGRRSLRKDRPFAGQMDDLRIYGAVLSPRDIQALASGDPTTSPPPMNPPPMNPPPMNPPPMNPPPISGAPYPASPVVSGITYRWNTYVRTASGSDNWPVTWLSNGDQLTSWGDGGGFGGGRVSLGFARIRGSHPNFQGSDIWRGAGNSSNSFDGKSYGVLAVGSTLYAWSRQNSGNFANSNAVMVRSTNGGSSWRRLWGYPLSSAINTGTFLQFGAGYSGARDNYVYSYFARSTGGRFFVSKPGRIDLARVPRDRVHEQSAYEFFAGMNGNQPRWTSNSAQRQPVFEDPRGISWTLSATYNPGIGRYLLITEHDETFRGKIGIFDAPEPWGPWTTVSYERDSFGSASSQAGSPESFFWNFSNRWSQGNDFVMVFTGIGRLDAWNSVAGSFVLR